MRVADRDLSSIGFSFPSIASLSWGEGRREIRDREPQAFH